MATSNSIPVLGQFRSSSKSELLQKRSLMPQVSELPDTEIRLAGNDRTGAEPAGTPVDQEEDHAGQDCDLGCRLKSPFVVGSLQILYKALQ